jgi:hypothetical protein
MRVRPALALACQASNPSAIARNDSAPAECRSVTVQLSRRQLGKAFFVYSPAAMAGGSTGFVVCQVGGHSSGQCPHMLSCPRASNSPRYW